AALPVVGAPAGVVDRQSAAQIDVMQVGAFGDEVGVEAADFRDAAADVLDVGDLRTEVAVQQLQAVQHAFRLQVVDQLDQLRGGQTEHAAIAGGGVPVAAHADRGLDAHADDGLDAH